MFWVGLIFKSRYLSVIYASFFSIIIPVLDVRVQLASAAERSVSPDGKVIYVCGDERESHSGCYTHWIRTSDKKGNWGKWTPGWCPSENPAGGMCWAGGVAWWYWKGEGEIGNHTLKDVWVRDYANLIGMSKSPENAYGDAIRLPGKDNCYKAMSFEFCMLRMK